MGIEHVHTFLVHPRSSEDEPNIGGAAVPLEGKLFGLLGDVYRKSDHECNIEISFNPGADGKQQNPCRDLITAYLEEPGLERAREIAQRLGTATDQRSGLGLLFLIAGKEDQDHKVVISRFPADSGILAEENKQELSVAFLERVFMKNAHSYKAAAYRGASTKAGFWQGRAIDKQIGNPIVRVSNYWIKGFLDSDFRTTSAAGTRHLALALRDAAKTTSDLAIKQEIAAAATLGVGLNGQATSIDDFQNRLGLSVGAKEAIGRQLKNPTILAEQFIFSSEEFSREISYRSVELDTGAVLSAPSNTFDEVVSQESVDAAGGRVRLSTVGTIVGEKLRKSV